MRILVVEDEKKLAMFIRKALREAGFAVDLVHNGDEALELANNTPFDAIVLDVMLPGRDGLSIVRILRERRNAVPILILTARAEVSERIEGLNLGADDYMTKPFSTSELVARLNALARRMGDSRFSLLKVEDLTMNLVTREVKRGSEKIELPPREFALLEFLMRSPGRVQSRTQICEHVWNYHFDPGTNLVDAYIQRLRRKIDDGRALKLIQTVRGVGYAMRPSE
ncbi:MAG TPA: response regulator transcription factor [Chthoniobacteraceae bacterium]|nr:response regulator transcription factor [Chthoniobacteraceae bacterium]